MSGPFDNGETEYWYHVMRREHMPLAGTIDLGFDLEGIRTVLAEVCGGPEADCAVKLASALVDNPGIFEDLRKLIGISNKEAYLELSYLASRTPRPGGTRGICGCYPWEMGRHTLSVFVNMLGENKPESLRGTAAKMLAGYLCSRQFYKVALGFSAMPDEGLRLVFENLISPREVLQKSAKRRGHGCEAELARVLVECGATLIPEEKHTNPMGTSDPHLDLETFELTERDPDSTFSFDILVMKERQVRIAIQSLIHTSDPGQYGVNKSNDTVAIKDQVHATNRRLRPEAPLELWGLLDGVGFSENKEETLNKMLRAFDYFLQLNTLYKGPLRLHSLGLCRVVAIRFADNYSESDIEAMRNKYVPRDVRVVGTSDAAPPNTTPVPAGMATLFVPST